MSSDQSTHDDVFQEYDLEGGEDGAGVKHWKNKKDKKRKKSCFEPQQRRVRGQGLM